MKNSFSRRQFLKASGVVLSLPALQSFGASDKADKYPKRMLMIMTNTGLMPRYFFPEGSGKDYKNSPYLELLKEHRERFTVFSGVSHPGVDGNHSSERCFLSCAPHPGASNFKNSISMDQLAVEELGSKTRFGSLVLGVGKDHMGTPSTTRDGVALPTEKSPANLYRQLFIQGSSKEVKQKIAELQKGRSLLDFIRNEAKSLGRNMPVEDKNKLEQYFSSIRDLEERLKHAEAWEEKPKPTMSRDIPKDIPDISDIEGQTDLMYDTLKLALETDSSRIITVALGSLLVTPAIQGVSNQTHALTHHGNDEKKIAELKLIEESQLRSFKKLLDQLVSVKEGSNTLLDNTMLLFGSNLSNANSHDTTNLPLIFAGGGFKHGRHLVFDKKNNMPLANLFVTILQNMGMKITKFASSTGKMPGIEK